MPMLIDATESSHYLSVVDMFLVPCTSLVDSHKDCTFFIRMVLTSFVEETNCGYVVRLVLFGATYDIQLVVWSNFILSPFSYWTMGLSWFFGVLSWPCTVVTVLFCVRTCHPGMMNQISVLNVILDLPLLVFNT